MAWKSSVEFVLLLTRCILRFWRALLGQEDFRALEALSNSHACVPRYVYLARLIFRLVGTLEIQSETRRNN
ncbi:hypothetical protein VN97_g6762 [Penicillium thymicola]|uniref:Secreted protein n=1 Tax=Penicillium thymicola TaxID=293382 RepID=A0AAI9TGA6_PENTH|nr:hypothetical protein VN97_g6762 [Penicillium thymicola]